MFRSLFKLHWILLPILTALLAVSCTGDPPAPSERAGQTYESFEDFLSHVFRQPGSGVFIVDGDTPIASLDELRQFYERHVRQGALIVHHPDGVDAVWDAAQKLNLSYCVGTSLGSEHDAVVAAMAAAAADWESAATVKFVYLPDQDANCTASNSNVVFDVNLIRNAPYIAAAFFPDSENANAFETGCRRIL